MESLSFLTNQAGLSTPMKQDFCFQAHLPQPTLLISNDVKISPKKHNMLKSLSSFKTFDDLSDSPLNILQTFKKSISVEFQIPKVKHSEILDVFEDEEFAPFSFPPEVTGFTQEDDDNHRAYRMELYFKPSLDVIPEEEEFEEPSKQKRSQRWKIKIRNMFKNLHLLCCFKKRC
ncbi:hypothetical protein TNIN_229371 [Trichonephila inaurata madagascariensis]|uniref:Uncharacterized protein n=1 Tax=Trichonephila inaurata madagascariensis TaxID=2747483 RepID=A0A8X6IUQ7_9ARAC|nr:hypothetical protein TNIN_229371 [Trichonephila inaurata madagascariensis]